MLLQTSIEFGLLLRRQRQVRLQVRLGDAIPQGHRQVDSFRHRQLEELVKVRFGHTLTLVTSNLKCKSGAGCLTNRA